MNIKKTIANIAKKMGYTIIKNENLIKDYLMDNDETFYEIYTKCKPYTMTSKPKMYALYKSTEYIIKKNVPGDFVECGVWKGGSAMVIAMTLMKLNEKKRKIKLYDTFTGMTEPSEKDRGVIGDEDAHKIWQKNNKGDITDWCYSPENEVIDNMKKTGYPLACIELVKGKVEDTLLTNKSESISLLRLDTDWYDSTKSELINLYPLLSEDGVLIIDDYGAWSGARAAVDEYFTNTPVLMNRIDVSGRLVIKN